MRPNPFISRLFYTLVLSQVTPLTIEQDLSKLPSCAVLTPSHPIFIPYYETER